MVFGLNFSSRKVYIYGTKEENGGERELRKEEDGQTRRKKNNINGSWQLCKTTCWAPNWPWITLALFSFSPFSYIRFTLWASLFQNHFQPRESLQRFLYYATIKKKKKIKRKPEQPRKQGKTATTNNKFLGELLIVFSYFFYFSPFSPSRWVAWRKPHLLPPPISGTRYPAANDGPIMLTNWLEMMFFCSLSPLSLILLSIMHNLNKLAPFPFLWYACLFRFNKTSRPQCLNDSFSFLLLLSKSLPHTIKKVKWQ